MLSPSGLAEHDAVTSSNGADAFGACCADFWASAIATRSPTLILEHDSGYSRRESVERYFESYDSWNELEAYAMGSVRGKALDIGVGVGRYALELQETRGLEVVGVDISQGAVELARERGLSNAICSEAEDYLLGCSTRYDTILLMGNNFGLVGRATNLSLFLGLLQRVLTPGGSVIGTIADPAVLPSQVVKYHREQGRQDGECTMRARYGNDTGSWFDYLYLTMTDLWFLIRAAGWEFDFIGRFDEFQTIFKIRPNSTSNVAALEQKVGVECD